MQAAPVRQNQISRFGFGRTPTATIYMGGGRIYRTHAYYVVDALLLEASHRNRWPGN